MTKLYKSTPSVQSIDDLPPQARMIVEEVRKEGVIKRDALLGALEEKFQGKYTQKPAHVLAFYRGRLITNGFMMEHTI